MQARGALLPALVPLLALVAACSPARTLRATYVANQGVLLSTGAHRVLVDALFDSPNPDYAAPSADVLRRLIGEDGDPEDIDLLLVTHNHPDHFRVSVAERFLLARPRARLIAPVDVVAALRDSATQWAAYANRITSLDLPVGGRVTTSVAGGQVHAFRTLHSGSRESPMNVMYLVALDGWRVFHEGDPSADTASFGGLSPDGRPVDLALLHFWYPFVGVGQQVLEALAPRRVALIHLPLQHERFTPEMFAGLGERFTLFEVSGQELLLRRP